MREEHVLHEEGGLTIVVVESSEGVFLELRGEDGWDLSALDDVVVAVNGACVPVESESASYAVADLRVLEDSEADSVELLVRVGEFFEGWELG